MVILNVSKKGCIMKKILVAVIGLLLLGACSSFVENRESRSTVYEGQTTWDLYENFGAPTRILKIGPNEYQFHYHKEAITRDWTRLYYDYCDMVFIVVDDRVVDWDQVGNQCHIYEAEGIQDTSGRLTRDREVFYEDGIEGDGFYYEDGIEGDVFYYEDEFYSDEQPTIF